MGEEGRGGAGACESEKARRGITSIPETRVQRRAVISSQLLFQPDRSAVSGDANGCSQPRVFYHQWRVIIFGNNQYWIVKPRDKVAGRAFKQSLTSVGLKSDGWISWDSVLEGLSRQTGRVTGSHLSLSALAAQPFESRRKFIFNAPGGGCFLFYIAPINQEPPETFAARALMSATFEKVKNEPPDEHRTRPQM